MVNKLVLGAIALLGVMAALPHLLRLRYLLKRKLSGSVHRHKTVGTGSDFHYGGLR